MCLHNLYTIGYSGFSYNEFIDTLKKYSIGAIIDVRSSPYSSYFEQYNMSNLKYDLNRHSIHYLFFGDELGAKPKDVTLYSNNVVDFAKMAKSDAFISGYKKIRDELNKFPICLMCAEKDPINCHRAIFITHSLRNIYSKINILHIISLQEIKPEQQNELDERVMSMKNLKHPNLWGMSYEDRLNEAYSLRQKEIAYVTKEMAHND